MNIKDEDSLKQSFAQVAKQILREPPSASRLSRLYVRENLNDVVDAVKTWLSLLYNTQWLMIFNNYNNLKLLGNLDPIVIDISKFLLEL
jgi:hypothetical protein